MELVKIFLMAILTFNVIVSICKFGFDYLKKDKFNILAIVSTFSNLICVYLASAIVL